MPTNGSTRYTELKARVGALGYRIFTDDSGANYYYFCDPSKQQLVALQIPPEGLDDRLDCQLLAGRIDRNVVALERFHDLVELRIYVIWHPGKAPQTH
jgi:hypothetical protein